MCAAVSCCVLPGAVVDIVRNFRLLRHRLVHSGHHHCLEMEIMVEQIWSRNCVDIEHSVYTAHVQIAVIVCYTQGSSILKKDVLNDADCHYGADSRSLPRR